MTSRERFESWMKERFPHSDTSRFALTMFISWQAAERDALERALSAIDEAAMRGSDSDAWVYSDVIRALIEQDKKEQK